jgi:hypothetical protein
VYSKASKTGDNLRSRLKPNYLFYLGIEGLKAIMSSTKAAVVQLIQTAIGKMSAILTAYPFLTASLHQHIRRRKAMGAVSIFPSISVINLTHFCPINTSFKPCIILGFEYVRTTQSYCLGKDIEIELKQNCDYISDMYIEVDTPTVSCSAVALPNIVVKPKDINVYGLNGSHSLNFGTGLLNTTQEELSGNVNVVDGVNYLIVANAPTPTNVVSNGKTYLLSPAAGNIAGSISYTYVDLDGNFVAGPDGTTSNPDLNGFGTGAQAPKVLYANYVRAADYLGFKYFSKNLFKVDDNPISEYSSMAMIGYRERIVSPIARPVLDRLIGQEVAVTQIADNYSQTDKTSSGFAVGGPQASHQRHHYKSAGGLQTPKPVQPSTRLEIPCIHWFNRALAQALPVACMPDGQLRLQLCVSPISSLFYPAPALYIQETITAYDVTGQAPPGVAGPGTQANPNVVTNRRIPYIIPGSVLVKDESCNTCITLVMNQILMDELIHNMIISRVGFNMIQLFREERDCVKNSDGPLRLDINQLKWPTMYIIVFDRPYSNFDDSRPETAENWWRCGYQSKYDASDFLHYTRKGLNVAGNASTWTKESLQVGCKQVRNVVDVISNLGVNLYDSYYFQPENRRTFYSDLLPFAFHNGLIHSDENDHGSIFITFSYLPGMYQVAGFANLSKTKELFYDIKFTVGIDINVNNKVEIISVSVCVNFLLISDGSCVVRYA